MKVVVIKESIIQPDLTDEETTKRWEPLRDVKGVDQLEIFSPSCEPTEEQLDEYVKDADAAIGIWCSKETINERFLSKHPNLKYIATLGHGFGEFDVELTRKLGITITNTIYGAQTIAEHAWALLMEVCHHISYHDFYIKNTNWSDIRNAHKYSLALTPQIELNGLTCGVIGIGAIGFAFAKMADAFGMHVISYSRHKKEGSRYDFIEQVSFDELLKRSDVISIHTPLTSQSRHMIDNKAISMMKDGVIIINTARGGIIDEDALVEGLNSRKIYGAGLDVITDEPATGDIPLFHCPNAVITGHIAWLTKASRLRTCDVAIENFKNYLSGHPTSVIN